MVVFRSWQQVHLGVFTSLLLPLWFFGFLFSGDFHWGVGFFLGLGVVGFIAWFSYLSIFRLFQKGDLKTVGL